MTPNRRAGARGHQHGIVDLSERPLYLEIFGSRSVVDPASTLPIC